MDYSDYLLTPHWQAKRAEALEFYGYSCVICGGQPDEVHHRHYNTLWHEDCAKDLIVLCNSCHAKVHPQEQPVYGVLTGLVFLALTQGWNEPA